MLIKIDGQEYHVNDDEFVKIPHDRFTNLNIRNDIAKLERLISLINELNCLKIDNLIIYNTTHGGFIPIQCSKNYQNIFAIETTMAHIDNFSSNINKFNLKNIFLKNIWMILKILIKKI